MRIIKALAVAILLTSHAQAAAPWLHVKLVLVLAMTGVHGVLSKYVREFAADKRRKSPKFFRILNEVPTAVMILIVLVVVLKPF